MRTKDARTFRATTAPNNKNQMRRACQFIVVFIQTSPEFSGTKEMRMRMFALIALRLVRNDDFGFHEKTHTGRLTVPHYTTTNPSSVCVRLSFLCAPCGQAHAHKNTEKMLHDGE